MRPYPFIGCDKRLHSLNIGGIQLRKVSELEHSRYDRMLILDFFKNVSPCAVSPLCFLARRKLEIFKKNLPKLYR